MTDTREEVATGRRGSRVATALWAAPFLATILVPPLFVQWVTRMHSLRWARFTSITLMVALVAAGVLAATWFLSGRRWRAALARATAIVLVVFFWPLFTDVGGGVGDLTGVAVIGDGAAVATAVLLLWLAFRMGDSVVYTVVVGGAVVALAVAMGAGLARHYAVSPPVASVVVEPATADPPATVVVLILDGYGRQDTLAEVYGIDNSRFLRSLAERGFTVDPAARSNYDHTYLALASMYSLDYVATEGQLSDATWAAVRRGLSPGSVFAAAMGDAGYETVYFENAWAGSNCRAGFDICIRDGMWASSAYYLGLMTIARPLVFEYAQSPFQRQGIALLQRLGDVAVAPDGGRRLTIAHVTVPHAPFHLDAHCMRVAGPHRGDEIVEGLDAEALGAKSAAFADQLECVNATVLSELDAVLAADPAAVVLITADHGPGPFVVHSDDLAATTERAIDARTRILMAARFPDRCEESGLSTPIDGMRRLVDCVLGTELGSLPPRLFMATEEQIGGEVLGVDIPGP